MIVPRKPYIDSLGIDESGYDYQNHQKKDDARKLRASKPLRGYTIETSLRVHEFAHGGDPAQSKALPVVRCDASDLRVAKALAHTCRDDDLRVRAAPHTFNATN